MEEKRKPLAWYRWMIGGLMLLVAYPLSMGPVARLIQIGYLPYAAFQFYLPIYDTDWPEPVGYYLFWSLRCCIEPEPTRDFRASEGVFPSRSE